MKIKIDRTKNLALRKFQIALIAENEKDKDLLERMEEKLGKNDSDCFLQPFREIKTARLDYLEINI